MPSEHKYALPPGLHLRQYIIVRLLGHGGFGLTYLADDTNLHRRVAIKELLPIDFAIREQDGATVVARSHQDQSNLQWARQRFVEEGRTLAALEHPSILNVFDIFELHGTAYLVTAFIEGSNFEERLRGGPLPLQEELLPLAVSLLDALQLVHQQGFLHRDIKPENILIDAKSSRPVLIDFGNARMATGLKTSNMTAVLTRGYAPFEQYQTKSRQGPFTDLFALGAVFYRAIKGAPPDDALDRMDEDKIQNLASQRISGYSPGFLATIDKALKMRAEDRWQSCEEWETALHAGAQPAPALPRQSAAAHAKPAASAPKTRPPSPPPRSAKAVLAITVLALLAVCAGGVGIYEWQKSQQNGADDTQGPHYSHDSGDAHESHDSAAATPDPGPHAANPSSATVDRPFVNSLGMKFVPVEITGGPTNGQRVLFSIWDTRVQDYAEYARAKGITPEKPSFEQGPTHPVVSVNWHDATSFCEWLTNKERASGKIGGQQRYRLPSDHEWSCAVGIGEMEKAESSPEVKRSQLGQLYPWGTQWPPPKGSGNYDPRLKADDFENTSPVGSFAANAMGLYDMGGNVWQWCADLFSPTGENRVLRGGAWYHDVELCLRSSFRADYAPDYRNSLFGFRCVLAPSGN